MKKPKIVRGYDGLNYVKVVERHANLTLVKNYQAEY